MSSKVNLHTRIPDDNVLSLTTLVSKCSLQLLTYFDNIVVSRHVRRIERGNIKKKIGKERKRKEKELRMHKPDVSPHVDWSLVWSVCMVSDEDQKTASYVLFGFRHVSGDEYYDGAFFD